METTVSTLFKWEPPAFIPPEAWAGFVEMRKKKGSRTPFTERARDLAVQQLTDMHQRGIDVGKVLDICTEMGWSGVHYGEQELSRRQPQLAPALSRRGDPPSRQAQALANLQEMKR